MRRIFLPNKQNYKFTFFIIYLEICLNFGAKILDHHQQILVLKLNHLSCQPTQHSGPEKDIDDS